MGSTQRMVDYAVGIANDDSHGYSQRRRWPEDGTDFDCSSLMYESAEQAGFHVKRGWPRYTGSMLADFTAAGFTAVPFDGNLADLDAGDILLNVTHHTEMCIGDGLFVGAHCSETGEADGAPGDQTGDEISIVAAYRYHDGGWDYVLVPPADGSEPAPTVPVETRGEGRKVQLWPSNGSDAQKWEREWVDKVWFRLRNVACGKRLDVAGGSGDAGTSVQAWPANDSDAQLWRTEGRAGDSCVNLVPRADEAMCLDVEGGSTDDGASLIIWPKHGGANQDWVLVENRDGTVTVINNGDGRKLALDVYGGGA